MKACAHFLPFVLIATFCAAPLAAQEHPKPSAEVDATVPVKPATPVPQPPTQPNVLQPQGVEKPADPSKVRATFELQGATVPITEGEFYDAYRRLEKFDTKQGMKITVERAYEHLLSYAEAKALGLEATAEEVALYDPLASNPELAKQTRERWEKDGITQAMYDAFQRESRTIQKAKDLFANSVRVSSSEIFDMYRRDHYTYRLEYVEFLASAYAAELRQAKPTDADLKKFWDENTMVQNKHRMQATVTADFVYFDPAMSSGNAVETRTVPREEAIAYYQKHKARLDSQIPSERRKELYPTGQADLTSLVTPFSILRPIIEREILLSGRVATAFQEAKAGATDLKALAAKHGLGFVHIEKANRDVMAQQHLRFGAQAFPVLSNLNPNTLSDEVKMEGQLHFFYRLLDKEQSRLPDFASVREQILGDYIETTSLQRAQNAAQEFRNSIDKKVDQEIAAEQETQLGKAEADANAEIKRDNVTDGRQIEGIKARYRLQAEAKIRQMKDGMAPKYFAQAVTDAKLKLLDTGPFEVGIPRGDRGANPEDAQARIDFLKTAYQVRTMEVGQISTVLSDAVTKSHFVVRVVEKAEPDFTKMTDSEILSFRSSIERNKSFQAVYRWTYYEISRRCNLVVK